MKIIFSRKGFDSSTGEGFSPIMPNRRMISFPIPEPNKKAEKGTYTKLADINYGDINLGELAKEIYPEDRHEYLSNENFHLDPDLHNSARPGRDKNWKGAFGQAQASLGHLKNFDVGGDDLFLFFGNFKHYKDCNQSNSFAKDAQEFHAIFGYLKVGEILKVDGIEDQGELKRIYKDHPHIRFSKYYNSDSRAKNSYTNAIYIAKDEFESGIPGWGTFNYNEKLRLSAPGYNKRIWKLPDCFKYDENRPMSYHLKKQSFFELSDKEILLKTVGRGQEFVIKNPSDEMVDWAKGLIREHHYFEDKRTIT